jgi:monoamine oxidase
MILLTLRSIPGGSSSLDDGNKGAQHFKIANGSQQLSVLLAEQQDVRLGDALVSVDYQSPSEILLTLLSGSKISCRRLLLAFSPTLLSRVSYMPPLSFDWHCCMTMGHCIKTIFIYSTPFWRGLETNQTHQQGPCSNIFDLAKPTALIGLVLGDQASWWCDREENELVEAIIKQYNTLYRADHRPICTFVHCWPKEEWSKGCYAGVYPPGALSQWENRCKTVAEGRIWLASTEVALEWMGYMEGAIEAGESTAKDILFTLQ